MKKKKTKKLQKVGVTLPMPAPLFAAMEKARKAEKKNRSEFIRDLISKRLGMEGK